MNIYVCIYYDAVQGGPRKNDDNTFMKNSNVFKARKEV